MLGANVIRFIVTLKTYDLQLAVTYPLISELVGSSQCKFNHVGREVHASHPNVVFLKQCTFYHLMNTETLEEKYRTFFASQNSYRLSDALT